MKSILYSVLFLLPIMTFSQTTVVDVIVDSPDHNTLEAAVLAANLAGTLSGDGPFTVFAPTDAAFDALPAGVLDMLLADTDELTDVLLFHVLSAQVLSNDLSDGQAATTLNGDDIIVTIDNGNVFINDAQVTVADITTDNGVVHVIDAVLIPPPSTTVVDIIVNSPDHNTLEAAVLAADLAGTLSGDGPFTVFAPTDAAFDALPAGVLDMLLADTDELIDVLLFHVLSAQVLSTDLSDGQVATTLNGDDIIVTIENGNVFINDAQVTVADITTDNGVVHVIDAVLMPITTSVNNENGFNLLEVFPNPTSGLINLNLEDIDAQSVNVRVFNSIGSNVQNFRNVINAINISELINGTYIMEVSTDESRYFKKVILSN